MIAAELRPTVVDQSWFIWGAALVIGFPILVIVLGEITNQLRRRGSPVATPLRFVRDLLLPGVVILLFMRFVIELSTRSTLSRSWTTVVWLFGIGIVLSLVTSIVFSTKNTDSWRGRAPRLFIDIVRFSLVAIGAAVIVSTVWGVNLGALFAALGVGGIVIGLALQDTLASLMAGVALLSEKPFTVGDWVVVGDVEGKIVDINWRTVRLQNREEDLIVIPNIVFGQQLVLNNSRPDIVHIEVVPLGFSYDDPPSKVHDVIFDVAMSTPGVLHDPLPQIRTVAFNDFSVDYEVWLNVVSYDEMPRIRSEFMTRVWYAARRHSLTIPFPIRTLQNYDAHSTDAASESAVADRRVGALADLHVGGVDLTVAAADSEILEFAPGETLLHEGSRSNGLGVIMSGSATASVITDTGAVIAVLTLSAGDFYGELSAFADEANRLNVIADTDVDVVLVPRHAVQDIARRSGRFSVELEQVVQSRRAVIDRAVAATTSDEVVRS